MIITNHLLNPSFEDGYQTEPEIPELQIPNDWWLWWADPDIPNPHDSAPHSKFNRPEVRVISREDLPEDERYLFILDRNHALKIFRASGAWQAALYQQLDLPQGRYKLTVRVFGDLVKAYRDGKKVWGDDPGGRDGLIRFVTNGTAGDWRGIVPGEWNTYHSEFWADGDTALSVHIMCPFALKNAGIFADYWSLERTDIEEQRRCNERAELLDFMRRTIERLPGTLTIGLGWVDAAALVLREYGYDIIPRAEEANP